MMNNSEKRRQQLLEQTRDLYHDRRFLPAVHPRYGAAYSQLYGDEDQNSPLGTLGLRTFLCFLLFAAFVAMDNQGIKVKNVNSDRIVEEITYNVDVSEVWKNL